MTKNYYNFNCVNFLRPFILHSSLHCILKPCEFDVLSQRPRQLINIIYFLAIIIIIIIVIIIIVVIIDAI